MGVRDLESYIQHTEPIIGKSQLIRWEQWARYDRSGERPALIIDVSCLQFIFSGRVTVIGPIRGGVIDGRFGGQHFDVIARIRLFFQVLEKLDHMDVIFVFDGIGYPHGLKDHLPIEDKTLQDSVGNCKMQWNAARQIFWRPAKDNILGFYPEIRALARSIADRLPERFKCINAHYEADPVVAYLASQRESYILSTDSDFFIYSGTQNVIVADSKKCLFRYGLEYGRAILEFKALDPRFLSEHLGIPRTFPTEDESIPMAVWAVLQGNDHADPGLLSAFHAALLHDVGNWAELTERWRRDGSEICNDMTCRDPACSKRHLPNSDGGRSPWRGNEPLLIPVEARLCGHQYHDLIQKALNALGLWTFTRESRMEGTNVAYKVTSPWLGMVTAREARPGDKDTNDTVVFFCKDWIGAMYLSRVILPRYAYSCKIMSISVVRSFKEHIRGLVTQWVRTRVEMAMSSKEILLAAMQLSSRYLNRRTLTRAMTKNYEALLRYDPNLKQHVDRILSFNTVEAGCLQDFEGHPLVPLLQEALAHYKEEPPKSLKVTYTLTNGGESKTRIGKSDYQLLTNSQLSLREATPGLGDDSPHLSLTAQLEDLNIAVKLGYLDLYTIQVEDRSLSGDKAAPRDIDLYFVNRGQWQRRSVLVKCEELPAVDGVLDWLTSQLGLNDLDLTVARALDNCLAPGVSMAVPYLALRYWAEWTKTSSCGEENRERNNFAIRAIIATMARRCTGQELEWFLRRPSHPSPKGITAMAYWEAVMGSMSTLMETCSKVMKEEVFPRPDYRLVFDGSFTHALMEISPTTTAHFRFPRKAELCSSFAMWLQRVVVGGDDDRAHFLRQQPFKGRQFGAHLDRDGEGDGGRGRGWHRAEKREQTRWVEEEYVDSDEEFDRLTSSYDEYEGF